MEQVIFWSQEELSSKTKMQIFDELEKIAKSQDLDVLWKQSKVNFPFTPLYKKKTSATVAQKLYNSVRVFLAPKQELRSPENQEPLESQTCDEQELKAQDVEVQAKLEAEALEKKAAGERAAEEKVAEEKRAAEENERAAEKVTEEMRATEEKAAADKKAAEEKSEKEAADKAAKEQAVLEKKVAEENVAEERATAADEKAAADRKAAEEQAAAEKKIVEVKAAADKKAEDERQKAFAERLAKQLTPKPQTQTRLTPVQETVFCQEVRQALQKQGSVVVWPPFHSIPIDKDYWDSWVLDAQLASQQQVIQGVQWENIARQTNQRSQK